MLSAIFREGRHRFLVADLSKKEDTHQIADHLAANHYDVLINNAGVVYMGDLMSSIWERWRR